MFAGCFRWHTCPSSGTTFITSSGYSPGTYFAFPMINGLSYAVSTCGNTIDTQITGWSSSSISLLFYNDDNGPLCVGSNASVDNYVPNFTGLAGVQVSQYNCSPGGSSSIFVQIRQNDNLVITSSGAAMCSGQTRGLTATPQAVGSVPGTAYGNPGTFTGTGVSGTVFTAPTVTATTVFTITYTIGYVSKTQTIQVNPLPTVAVTAASLCAGNSATLVASGASTYTWSTGSVGGTLPISPATSTVYSVYGSSAAGCISSNTAVSNVTVSSSPTISVNSGSLCSGRVFTLVPSGASTYTYSSGSATVSPAANTAYSVTGTSAQGCVSSNTAVSNVTVHATPTVVVNSGSLCSGASFTLVPTGASTYTFSGGSAVVVPTTSTSYSVTGTSAQGCVSSNTAIGNVTVTSAPTVAVNSGSLCSGASFTMVPSGASSYTFSSGSAVVTPTVTSTYTVTGANAQGCLSSPAVSNVTVFATPTLAVVGSHSYACTGITPTLTVSGAQTYTWSTSSTATAITVSPTASTLYSVTGASSQGCVSAPVVTSIVYVPQPTLSTQQNTAVCNGATLSLPAGNGNMTYNWSGGVTGGVPFTVTANASYSATATNTGNGCQQPNVSVVNVTAVAIPVVSLSVVAPVICYGATTAINATGAQQYSFSTGVTNGIGFAPGSTANYTVLGFNQQGNTFCFGASAVTGITVNPTPTITITKTSSVMCVGETATISLTGPTNYTWSTGSTASFVTISPTVVANVGFTVDFVSAQGCTNTAAVTQTVSACTGVAERTHGSRINLFPNPSQGLFTLEFDTEGRKQVQVFNSVGQMIFIRSVNTMREEFDLSELPKGIYYFSISEAGSTRYIKAITE